MIISAILAVGRDGEIGLNGSLPWNSEQDLQYFKKMTSGHYVLMGFNTYKSIGKPLPNRVNIVISKLNEELYGCYIFHSIEDGINFAKQNNEKELFIIGGASIYKYCAEKNLINRIYLTNIIY